MRDQFNSIERGAEALDSFSSVNNLIANQLTVDHPSGGSLEIGDGTKRSQTTILLELCESLELFHDTDLNGYAIISLPERREVWPIQSSSFQRWLEHQYYQRTQQAARTQAIKDAANTLEARARYNSPKKQVFRRVAWQGDRIYIDLADDQWRVIEIDTNGWRVLDRAPIMFIRGTGIGALPVPVEGNLVTLAQMLNIRPEDFPLVAGWLLMAASGHGPYPVLVVQGEHGSGKSSFTRIVRNLIDPSVVPLRGLTNDTRDLVVTATNNHVIVLDNLSGLSPELSDIICRFATGGGFAERKLYTNNEELVVNIQRPVILNGIDEIATRGDLMDRAVIIHLPVIPDGARVADSDAQRRFEVMHPSLLGGLCTALSHALREMPNVWLPKMPRMADFVIWVTAAEGAFGWDSGTFMRSYQANRDVGMDAALDAAPFAEAVIHFIEVRQQWRGTATDLLNVLEPIVPDRTKKAADWPKSGKGVSNALKRAGALLRYHQITLDKPGRSGPNGDRVFSITKVSKQTSAKSVASVEPEESEESEESFGEVSTSADVLTKLSVVFTPNSPVLSDGSVNMDALVDATDATDIGFRTQYPSENVVVDV